jgi:hypothetical protein
MDGKEACVIVREEGSPPYQTMVPFGKLAYGYIAEWIAIKFPEFS